MATETQKPEVEAPNKSQTLTTPTPLDLNQDSSNSDVNPNLPAHNGTAGATPAIVSPTGASSNDNIQKKMKRAERFGVPVNMSEEEKRNSRSERFGTAAGSEVPKSAEEQKQKARAERFGISVPADDEAVKKKSRAERFGSDTKVDNAEEERRKARALRFAHSQATAVVPSNAKKDSSSQVTATRDSAIEGA